MILINRKIVKKGVFTFISIINMTILNLIICTYGYADQKILKSDMGSSKLLAEWSLDKGEGQVVSSIPTNYKGILFGSENHCPVWKDKELYFRGNKGYGGIRVLGGGKILHGPLFQIKFDVKPEKRDFTAYLLSCKALSFKSGGFNVHYWGNQRKLSLNFSNGIENFKYNVTLPEYLNPEVWNNIIINYNGADLSFHLNGKPVKIIKCPGLAITKSKTPLYIGCYAYDYSDKGTSSFTGTMRNIELSRSSPAPNQPKFLTVNTRGIPVIDGSLNDEIWKETKFQNSFVYYIEGKNAEPQTYFAVCCDDKNLYLAVKCPDKNAENIKAEVKERDGPVSSDDSIDIFIDPDFSGNHCFQFELNAGNTQNDAVLTCFGTRRREDFNMVWKSATQMTNEGWTAEIAFPFKELLISPENNGNWYFNICRACATKEIDKYSTWGFLSKKQGPGRGFQDFRLLSVLHGLPKISFTNNEFQDIRKKREKWGLDSVPVASEIALIPIHDTMFIGNNMLLPNSFILNVPGSEIIKKKASYILDLPEGIEFIAMGGSDKHAGLCANPGHYKVKKGDKVAHKNERYQRYIIKPILLHPNRRCFGPFYLKSSLADNTEKSLYYGTIWDEGKQELNRISIISKNYPTPGMPDKIIACYAWLSLFVEFTWPDFLDTYGKIGFNTVPVMAGSFFTDDKIKDFASDIRKNGYKTIFVYSPFYGVKVNREGNSTDKNGKPLQGVTDACPAYRGKLYLDYIQKIEKYASLIKPDYAQFDIEQYFHGAFRGRSGECSRCAEYIKNSGLETEQAMRKMGTEIMSDIKNALAKAANEKGFSVPLNGNYHTEPGGFVYDGVFDFDEMLSKGAADMCNPVFYTSSFAKDMGKKLREMKKLYACKIVPWLTMGYSPPPVEYPPEWVYDFVLEAYGSGVAGIYWYSHIFEAADFYYYAKAMEAVNPVSGILGDSELMEGLDCENDKVTVSGLKNKDEYVILISCYEENPSISIRIKLPGYVKGQIWDLARKKSLGVPDGNNIIQINFAPGVKGAHTALYYIGKDAPKFK